MKLNLPRLSYSRICVLSDEFLNKNHPSFLLPIPIEEIAESKLNIEIIPIKGLRQKHDVDGCLDSTLSRVFIDLDLYIKNENRTRFTIAHEIGHLVLHEQVFIKLGIKTEEDIFKLTVNTTNEDYGWLEYQAYAFAGNVLVPKTAIIQEVEKRLGKISRKLLPEEIFPISQELLELFKVSGEVILRRLQKEGIIKINS